MASGIRTKGDLSRKMIAKMRAIPVWPDEVSLGDLARQFCCKGVPTNAPIGEYNGKVCYPDKKTKERYLNELSELWAKLNAKVGMK